MGRYTVSQAAEQLGISPEAVRSRLYRGSLTKEVYKGRVFVRLDADQVRSVDDQANDQTSARSRLSDSLIDEMRARIEDLRTDRDAWREQARRSDILLGNAMERTRELENQLRELEAVPERPESTETVREEDTGTQTPGASPAPETGSYEETSFEVEDPPRPRSWWRRWFGR